MKVRVSTRMKDGRILPWNGVPLRSEGTFVVFMKDRDGLNVPTVQVSGQNRPPPLYDARVISISEDYILLAGVELVDGQWQAQEWKCEILAIKDELPAPQRCGRVTREEPW